MAAPLLRPPLRVSVLAALVALPACGDEAGRDPPTAGTLDNLTLERVAHASGTDVPWGRIVAVASTAAGQIVVADDQSLRIFVLDSDGSLLRSFGGRGDGPGEFASLFDLVVQGEDVLALDALRRRVTRLSMEGEVRSTLPLPAEAGLAVSLLADGPDAVLMGRVIREQVEPEPGGILRARQPSLRYLRISGDDSLVELALADTANAPRGFDCFGPGGGVAIFGTPLLGPAGPLRAFVGSGRMARGSAENPAIEWVDVSSGETVELLAFDAHPQPLTDGDWATVTLPFRERAREEGPFECEVDGLRPTHWPPVRSIVADERGWLWIEMADERNERFRIAAFDTDGRLRAAGALPERDARVPFHVLGNRIYLVTSDALGLQSVEVYAAAYP